jgi:Concanavalin A-like lectin/glucanases superfamily
MSFNFSPKIVQDGLILYVDAANPKSYPGSGTLWTDLTRNRYNGTLVNGPTFNGDNGGSVVFDGVDDFVESSSYPTPNGLSEYTMSVWINNVNDTGGIINNWDSVADSGFEMELFFGNIYIAFTSNEFGTVYYGGTNSWVNFTTVYNGNLIGDENRLKFYVNGSEVTLAYNYPDSIPSSISVPDSANTLKIGKIMPLNLSERFIEGKISNTMIYNKPLSPSEVLQNYNALKSRFGL